MRLRGKIHTKRLGKFLGSVERVIGNFQERIKKIIVNSNFKSIASVNFFFFFGVHFSIIIFFIFLFIFYNCFSKYFTLNYLFYTIFH